MNAGTLFVFLLMAGEIYTTFSFLGGSGYAYGHGGPVLYILFYGCIAYTLSYWLLPPVWRYAKQHRLISQPDFFARKYDSPALGLLVACWSTPFVCCGGVLEHALERNLFSLAHSRQR